LPAEASPLGEALITSKLDIIFPHCLRASLDIVHKVYQENMNDFMLCAPESDRIRHQNMQTSIQPQYLEHLLAAAMAARQ